MEHEACNAYRVWLGNLKERDHLEEPDLDVRTILNCILKKKDVMA